jgi:hypothetical protein
LNQAIVDGGGGASVGVGGGGGSGGGRGYVYQPRPAALAPPASFVTPTPPTTFRASPQPGRQSPTYSYM